MKVSFRVTESTRRVYPTEETKVTGSNARLTARYRRTPYEWNRVGLRVNDKAGGVERNLALE